MGHITELSGRAV